MTMELRQMNTRRNSASSSTAESSCNNPHRIRRKKKTKTSNKQLNHKHQNHDDDIIVSEINSHQDQSELHLHHKPRRKLLDDTKTLSNAENQFYNTPNGGAGEPLLTKPAEILPQNEVYPLLHKHNIDLNYRKNSSDMSR